MNTGTIRITLKNVRLSFPDLFQPRAFDGKEPKYGATFLLDKVKDAEQISALRKAVGDLLKSNNLVGKVSPDRFCISDGDDKTYDGYAGQIAVKAGGVKRPSVVNRDLSPITERDNVVYAGCYVNASIELWAQDNSYGKRINAWLNGVQFVREGTPFGSKFDAASEFSDISETSPVYQDDPNPVTQSQQAVDDLPF